MKRPLSVSQVTVSHSLLKPHFILFTHLLSSNHKSTQTCPFIVKDDPTGWSLDVQFEQEEGS
jgi:hypothetical protein